MLKTFCDRCQRPGGSYERFQDVQDDSRALLVRVQVSARGGPVLEICDNCYADVLDLTARAAARARPLTKE